MNWAEYWKRHPDEYQEMQRQFAWAFTAFVVLLVVILVFTVLVIIEVT